MERSSLPRWEGKVSTRLTKASAEQIWPFFKDFFNLHKWFPSLATSYGILGTNGEPGCVRYCAGFSIPSIATNDDDSIHHVNWSTEKLVAVDDTELSLSYEMVDSNIGFKSYVSTVKIVPVDGDDELAGCRIEWCFAVDPVEGWVLDDLVRKYDVGLQLMAKQMESGALEARGPQTRTSM